MRFFHLSDLHIGLKLFGRDLKEDQEYILEQIIKAAEKEKPDAVVIAGDIYDKAIPSAEAVELFDRFICGLSQVLPEAEIMVVSGNHDSAPRVDLYRHVLKERRIRMIGMPPRMPDQFIEKVTLSDAFGPVHFYLLPFVKPSMIKLITGTEENGNNLSYNEALHRLIEREQIIETERNVLVSHQFYVPKGSDPDKIERMDSEIRTLGNIDEVGSDVLEKFDYAALGHIHKPMKAGNERFRYCGTPLACSVSEAGQEKAILMVELKQKGELTVSALPLIPLRQVRVISGLLEEVLTQACDDYVTVVLTDQVDLDVFDMQDRLRHAFPHLLEIRRQLEKKAESTRQFTAEEIPDTFTLCRLFLNSENEKEQALLADIIRAVQEVD